MKIIRAGYEILTPISDGGIKELQHIEKIGRVCYKSEDKMSFDGTTAKEFVKKMINKGHEAMLEHSTLSVKFIVDRGVSHELVRHRIASFAQESTRYCNYSKDKFENGITVIAPWYWKRDDRSQTEKENKLYTMWYTSMIEAEYAYLNLLSNGASAEEARSVLPNSLKTEITMTANYREWRNFFKLRTAMNAHPQMREVTVPLLKELQRYIPVIFDDIIPYQYHADRGKDPLNIPIKTETVDIPKTMYPPDYKLVRGFDDSGRNPNSSHVSTKNEKLESVDIIDELKPVEDVVKTSVDKKLVDDFNALGHKNLAHVDLADLADK